MENKKVHGLVKHYVEVEKRCWSAPLVKQDYSEIEEDLTDDGQWHGKYPDEFRPLGKVAFWKQKGIDGIVVRHVKFYSDSGCTGHGTGVNAIGNAYNYFNELYKSNQKEHSLIKKLLGHKKEELIAEKEKIKINDKEFDSMRIYDIMEFYDLIKLDKSEGR